MSVDQAREEIDVITRPRLGRRALFAAAGVPAAPASAAILADLRVMDGPPPADLYLVTDPRQEGLFRRDSADSASLFDDSRAAVS
jgi:hypothetical protein